MEVNAGKAGFSGSRLEWITDHINRNYIDPGKISGCQVLVSRHGVPAYHRSFGRMDIERDKPMTDDTIFRIYSMSKPITSVALMPLYERGHFQLNDPVYRVIPEWRDHKVWVSGEGEGMETRQPDQPMTFRHVLSHTGGLTYGSTDHPVDRIYRERKVSRTRGETLRSFVEKLGDVPLRYQPGEKWLYSYSTDVCGYLVEAISGQPFDEYLQQNIFDPLGMKDTSFFVEESKRERFAANYRRNPDKTLTLVDDPGETSYAEKPDFLSGGGGLTGTTADYYNFCEMLRRGGEFDGERILGSRTLHLMTRNHLKGGSDLTNMAIGAFSETANEGVGFGLGFAMTLGEVEAGGMGSGDYYWGGAASTIFWVDPAEDLVVIFMTQPMQSATFHFRGQ
ncbi:MAG: beta-lactamase family protein, partial [Pseudomonadales bacterium]|nr:beta-lactamase family protein [Pseudomonadales bacterium]